MYLSTVIATLGGDVLKTTINTINQGTVSPEEILVCIPETEAKLVSLSDIPNVKVLPTPVRGQVAQRAHGFTKSKGDYVLQIDDDIVIENDCIETLINTIKDDNKMAVAPSMFDIETGKSIYFRTKYSSYLELLYYYVMNGMEGYQPGKIDKSGTAVGVDPDEFDNEIIEVEWLAGGCVLHHKANLVLKDYFPFKGKAFGEDVIHSHYLKKSGVKLLINTNAKCNLEKIPSTTYSFSQWLKNLYGDYRVRRHHQNLSGRKSIRIYAFYIASISTYLLKRLKSGVVIST